MNFIKNSLREFKHVVWPTREETKKYFITVLIVLIAFGIFLFVFGSLFGNALRGLKNIVNPSAAPEVNSEIPIDAIDVNTLNGEDGEVTPLEIDSVSVEGVSVDDGTNVSDTIEIQTEESAPVINTEVE